MLIVTKPFHSSLKGMSQQLLRMTIARPFDTKGQPLELRNEASVEVQKNSSSNFYHSHRVMFNLVNFAE